MTVKIGSTLSVNQKGIYYAVSININFFHNKITIKLFCKNRCIVFITFKYVYISFQAKTELRTYVAHTFIMGSVNVQYLDGTMAIQLNLSD